MTTQTYSELATPGVQGLSPYLPGKSNDSLEREYGITDSIKLASNENPLGPSESVLASINESAKNICLYPDGNGTALKEALSEFYTISQDLITLGNGSNDVLELVARTFAGPGDEIIFSQYGFAVYPIAAKSVGATGVMIDAVDWGHDLVAMFEAITEKTKVIFIANPNNPTGTWLTATEVETFLDRVPSNVIVVLDEAYNEYISEPEFPSSLQYLAKYPNLVITRTFSKIYGLAGLRVGYGFSNPEIADLINRVRQPFNVNSIALNAAVSALNDQDYVKRSRDLNAEQGQILSAALSRLGLSYIPSVGNFISCDTREPAMEVYENLLQRGLIVRPVLNYGMENHLRITIGTEDQNRRFIAALEDLLS